MKNYKACLFTLGLTVGMIGMVYGANYARGAKGTNAVLGTTVLAHISSGPVVIYSVILTSGAGNDFVALFDSGSVTGLVGSSMAGNFKTRLYSTGTSTTTAIYNFDPPLQFNNGLVAANSTAGINTLITLERGRVSGN